MDMSEFNYITTEKFTRQEKEIVDRAVSLLKDNRCYSDKPRFFHDVILLGCQSILTGKATE